MGNSKRIIRGSNNLKMYNETRGLVNNTVRFANMEITSSDIWKSYWSSNWQGPIVVAFIGVVAATINGDFPLNGLVAGLFALVFSYLIFLILGVPLLFSLKTTNRLSRNMVLFSGVFIGSIFAIWFYLSVPLFIYPLSAIVCGASAGWFASKSIFCKPNKSLNQDPQKRGAL